MPAGSKVAEVENALKRKGLSGSKLYGTLNNMGLMRGNQPTKKGLQRAAKGIRRKK